MGYFIRFSSINSKRTGWIRETDEETCTYPYAGPNRIRFKGFTARGISG
jgi:hypothetical protein